MWVLIVVTGSDGARGGNSSVAVRNATPVSFAGRPLRRVVSTDPMTFTLREHFDVDGIELAWDRWGPDAGTPLVFCHGYSGSADDFALSIPTFAEERPVFAVDHRGHGRSTKTQDEAAYRIDRLADDLAAWLTACAGAPVDLLGHSMGGRIVLQVALDHPELVRSLVLMDTSARNFIPDPEIVKALVGFLEQFDPERGLPSSVGQGVGPEQDLIDAALPDDVRSGPKGAARRVRPLGVPGARAADLLRGAAVAAGPPRLSWRSRPR